ncbi:MAG: arsenate reductase (glutaredoxin) [Rhodospirillaceae bacterium]|jgi:arsenate reductase (glutaredoxin)|nr:arsenate reductase (glutaredoxin) [Rhodospirillaceae bacterium]MBT5245813.1 arsenate reductase (glutaredoxin) [Rhodospirillaceae bacterium]MBT5561356.1 arsenate reductase (glutaredoxin) [Rhodospirillaceae bacterium]MBT6242592.1 arsenate reductase (glutaredoxin) [Rhodospirillaceae bacterium]MBT7136374.1 arsenate reductase (glutaredoxin) [Rhodospirillaceae bacterium]
MSVTIYHNPRCSKSRTTLALLQNNNADPVIVEYLNTPPSVEELKNIISLLGIAPRELLRAKDAREAGVDASLDDDALIAAMVANPIVIERPIVVAGGKAKIGRPPEDVLDIL